MCSEAGFDRGGVRFTERFSERFLSMGPDAKKRIRIRVLRDGPEAKCGNRGRRTRLQRRLGRLDGAFSYPGIESRSKPKKTRHGSVPCLVYGRSKDLGFQTTARAFQTEQRQAEQSNGRAAFWNSGAVSRSIEPAVDFVS